MTFTNTMRKMKSLKVLLLSFTGWRRLYLSVLLGLWKSTFFVNSTYLKKLGWYHHCWWFWSTDKTLIDYPWKYRNGFPTLQPISTYDCSWNITFAPVQHKLHEPSWKRMFWEIWNYLRKGWISWQGRCYPNSLSGGQSNVAIARGLAYEPRILCLWWAYLLLTQKWSVTF